MNKKMLNVVVRISNREGVIRTRELELTPSAYQKYQDIYDKGESYKGYKLKGIALR